MSHNDRSLIRAAYGPRQPIGGVRLQLRAVVAGYRAVQILEAHGLAAAMLRLSPAPGTGSGEHHFDTVGRWAGSSAPLTLGPAAHDRDQWLRACELRWRLLVASRLLRGSQKCLPEAVFVCAGLRAIGVGAEVVIGHAANPISALDRVHAWVELAGRPFNPEVLPGYYLEIARLPAVCDRLVPA